MMRTFCPPGWRSICFTRQTVPTAYMSSRNGKSLVISFCAVRKSILSSPIAILSAAILAGRSTSKFRSIPGKMLIPRSVRTGIARCVLNSYSLI